jgi:hypothetical protein
MTFSYQARHHSDQTFNFSILEGSCFPHLATALRIQSVGPGVFTCVLLAYCSEQGIGELLATVAALPFFEIEE